jgi:hypothetical protein
LSYLNIQDWKYGMDRRRPQAVGVPGTLWTLENAVITRGGDIERAKKWVSSFNLPAGQTHGFATLRGQPWVFGSVATPSMSSSVQYQQLLPGAASAGMEMTAVLDARAVAGKLYVIAEFADGSLYHYYDGARVTDWDTIAGTDSVPETLAIYIANQINAQVTAWAYPVGSVIVIQARLENVPFTIGSTTGIVSTTLAAAPGVRQVSQVDFSGSPYAAGDLWDVYVDGVGYLAGGYSGGVGTYILVYKQRLYCPVNSLLRYTKINTFTDWTTTTVPASDAGFIDMSSESEGTEELVAAATYNGFVAVFSNSSIRIWSLQTDAEENNLEQVLDNTGTVAPQSVISFGETDTFYLDTSGIRSIKAREGYDAGYVSDVGSAIDDFVREQMEAVGSQVTGRATGMIEPVDGRYTLAIGDKVIVLSYFPASKITAWSYMSPGVTFEKLLRVGNRTMARAGDTIYIYGGLEGDTYPDDDEFECVVETPFMSANDPAAIKLLNGFDLSVEGEWLAEVLVDPNDTTKSVTAGTFNRSTYHLAPAKLPGRTSHVAFRFTCSTAGAAKIMTAAIHYEKEGAE